MPVKSGTDYKKLTDEELILRFQKDEIDAFNELVHRYKDRIMNFLYRYTGSREEAEDNAQDAFLNLYKSKHLYQPVGKFSSWFYRIAINIAKTNYARKKRMSTVSISNADPDEEKDYELPAKIISPEESAQASIEDYYIQKALENLNEKYREVVILRDVQDLEYDEIAKITNLPLGTVKSRINRGRECLKEMLQHIYKSK